MTQRGLSGSVCEVCSKPADALVHLSCIVCASLSDCGRAHLPPSCLVGMQCRQHPLHALITCVAQHSATTTAANIHVVSRCCLCQSQQICCTGPTQLQLQPLVTFWCRQRHCLAAADCGGSKLYSFGPVIIRSESQALIPFRPSSHTVTPSIISFHPYTSCAYLPVPHLSQSQHPHRPYHTHQPVPALPQGHPTLETPASTQHLPSLVGAASSGAWTRGLCWH